MGFFNLIVKEWNLPALYKGAPKRRMMMNERNREDLLRQLLFFIASPGETQKLLTDLTLPFK
jgi:hypothetical protein